VAYEIEDFIAGDWNPMERILSDRLLNWYQQSYWQQLTDEQTLPKTEMVVKYVPYLPSPVAPSPNFYAVSAADRLAATSPQRATWDEFAYTALRREPFLEPLWRDLRASVGGSAVWNDFRGTPDGHYAVATLGLSARGLLRKGGRFAAKVAREAIPYVKRVPPIAAGPQGVATWIAGQLAWEGAMYVAEKLVDDFIRDHPPTKPPGGGPVRPPRLRRDRNIADDAAEASNSRVLFVTASTDADLSPFLLSEEAFKNPAAIAVAGTSNVPATLVSFDGYLR
jgi:hypothetical protein